MANAASRSKSLLKFFAVYVAKILGYGLLFGIITALVGLVWYMESRPDLSVWQTADLDIEFTADSGIDNLKDYLELESRLFEQLDELVYAEVPPAQQTEVNRYSRGSLSDPGRWPQNWNQSFTMSSADPKAGVLLLHGLTDSPYSVRTLATDLHAVGASVLAIRIPGHGTAPSGLVTVRWEDMAAAVSIAVADLRKTLGDKPLYVVGYSNGAALALHHVLLELDESSQSEIDALVLLSPEIEITRLAAFAIWQERLGFLLGLEKLQWNAIQPEYDPYKYNSFALNGARQVRELTVEIQNLIGRRAAEGRLEDLPPILAFQSVVDDTVLAPALVNNLFARLPAGKHELVLFDINRFTDVEPLMYSDPAQWITPLLGNPSLPYVLTVVGNENDQSRAVVARRHTTEGDVVCNLDMDWPRGIYSLSHVALPFAPDDPLYGGPDAAPAPGIEIGDLALRGERGVLQISAADLLRLKWNPFFDYLRSRSLTFLDLSIEASSEGDGEVCYR